MVNCEQPSGMLALKQFQRKYYFLTLLNISSCFFVLPSDSQYSVGKAGLYILESKGEVPERHPKHRFLLSSSSENHYHMIFGERLVWTARFYYVLISSQGVCPRTVRH